MMSLGKWLKMYATILEYWDEEKLDGICKDARKAGFDVHRANATEAVIVAKNKLWAFLQELSGQVRWAFVGCMDAEDAAARYL